MLFTVLLYISLFVFLLGLIYKVSTWFSRKIGIASQNFTTSERISAAVKSIPGVIFSPKILILIKVFMLDVVLQRKNSERRLPPVDYAYADIYRIHDADADACL
jgi:hypothetical protein